jgi:hypothetical protein
MPLFTDDDIGKTVINPVGDEVGTIEVVEDGVAYVDLHPDLGDRIRNALGWEKEDPDIDEYPLDDEDVEEITDDRVILRQDLHTDRSGTL